MSLPRPYKCLSSLMTSPIAHWAANFRFTMAGLFKAWFYTLSVATGSAVLQETSYLNSRFSAASFSPGSLELSAMGMTEMPRARSSVRNSSDALSALLR